MPNPLDPRTWLVVCGDGSEQPLHTVFDWFAKAIQTPLEHAFVQFRMDDLGRHEYVCLREAYEKARGASLGPSETTAAPLAVILEDEVKSLRQRFGDAVVVLNAALPQEGSTQPEIEQDALELCPPRGLRRNYTVCEDLTLGRTRRVMLSDEDTLHVGVETNGVQIFNHLKLIVNCHETADANTPGKYSVGSAKPSIIFQPIHQLLSANPQTIVKVMDSIQQRIWECSQEGSVVVHCLAGVHRAPTVVVCQYLYRHYALGQTEVCKDVETIYARLRSVRPHVEPLSYIRLISTYETYLKAAYATCSSESKTSI